MARLYRGEGGKLVLDVRGYVCPYPVIYTKKALSRLEENGVLEVLIDNPPSCETVPKAASEEGHEVLGVEKVGEGVWKITIKKKR